MIELIDFKISKYQAIRKEVVIECLEHQKTGDLLLWGFKEGTITQIDLIIKDLKDLKKALEV